MHRPACILWLTGIREGFDGMGEPDNFVICRVEGCGAQLRKINHMHLATHGMSRQDYEREHPGAPLICDDLRQKYSDARLFNEGFSKFINDIFPPLLPLCECGCGERVCDIRNRYIMGHAQIGRKHTPEERKKRTKKLRGLKRTVETRERIRLATLGHPVSEETREKLSAALKGYIPSDEARRNMGAAQQRIWSEYTSEERVIRIRKISVRQSPNNEEIRLGEILLELGYVFNRRLLCSGHSSITGRMRSIIPDFVSKEHPMYIVQYDGWLGHSPDSHRTRDDQAEWDNERDEICSDNGYTVIRVYPEDLRKGGKHIKDMMEEIICQSINM